MKVQVNNEQIVEVDDDVSVQGKPRINDARTGVYEK